MARQISTRVLFASSLTFGVLGFVAGGFHGFSQGRAAGLFASSADAFVTSMALRAVREGRSNDAIKVLEGRLESELVLNASSARSAHRSLFNDLRWLGIDSLERIDELAARGASYWLSQHPDADEHGSPVSAAVREVVARGRGARGGTQ
jgi:hypothetical protein